MYCINKQQINNKQNNKTIFCEQPCFFVERPSWILLTQKGNDEKRVAVYMDGGRDRWIAFTYVRYVYVQESTFLTEEAIKW